MARRLVSTHARRFTGRFAGSLARSVAVALLLPLLLAAPTPASAKKALSVEEQYELGLKYLNRSYYVKALETFNRIRNYHRDDPMAVKAELAIADVHFKKSDWDQARLAYEDFVRMHPRHADVDYVVWRIGESLYQKAPRIAARDQTWTRQAVNTWSGFEARFPDSEYRDDVLENLTECRERLALKELQVARFYKRRAAWRAVEGRAAGLVRTSPTSQHVPEALGLLAEAHAWQGEAEQATEALQRLEAADANAARRVRERVDRAKPDPEQ
jgi:outer membrane protein assembly factor BamD